jgi:outer membrane protein OmpA-like peptidoglycan-associated protein
MNAESRRTALTALAAWVSSCAIQLAAQQFVSTMPTDILPVDKEHARSFVTCPIFRNTERQCWLARSGGVTYYIDPGTGYRPQLGFKVLVEGQATNEPKICGGVVLNPIHVSVLPERAPQCETILPAAGFASPPIRNNFGYVKHADDPPLPKYEPGTVLGLPAPPYHHLHYTVYFMFDRAFLPEGTTEVIVEAAAAYIRASKATQVTVTGYAGSSRLDDGHVMVETGHIAEQRAKLVADALAKLGTGGSPVDVRFIANAAPADGVTDADHRKVVIEIEPAPSSEAH